jgi:peptide deformylase
MLETMYDAPGVGLAANQVGILERVIVVDTEYEFHEMDENNPLPPEKLAEGEVIGEGLITGKKPLALINPVIVQREGKILFKEGCLSVPEFQAEVERSEKIHVEYLDLDGLTRRLSGEGLFAVCIQHEIDHLDGKLFIDHLSPMKKSMVQKRLRKEREWRERDPSGDET